MRRSAISLAELLVVIALLGLLLALLLPALQASVATARLVRCQSNLRSWGQAVHAYLAATRRYPPAATWRVGERADGRVDPPRHSVFTYLLPYCEEQTLYQHVDLSRDWNDPVNDRWTHQDLAGIFLCPAAPGQRTDKHVSDYSTAVRVDPSQRSGLGRLLQAGRVRNRSRRAGPDWGLGSRVWEGILQLDQVDHLRHVADRRIVRARDVVDGTSKTVLFFENAGKPLCYRFGRLSDCQITRFRWASSSIWMTINDVCGQQQLVNCHNNSQPYGFHAQGLNLVWADGSVRFLTAEVDADVFVSAITAAARD
jgi:prepilin-type processing-associated H-X9-DG protein